jgi:chromate transporter
VVGVILNLAIWFAIHSIFHATRPLREYGLSLDIPVPASLDPFALALSIAAVIAIFRFKTGMIPTLLACSAVGILLYLGGAIAFAAHP